MSRLAKVTLLYTMIDSVSDSIKWDMFAHWSGPAVGWMERVSNMSGVKGSLSPYIRFY